MPPSHKWAFKARFRTHAYPWNGTALASKRMKEAVSEIKKVAKSDLVLAGEGCVAFMERVWPSLQGIDGSSGALGSAVVQTLNSLIPILIDAPADRKTRAKWLKRLYDAVHEDGVDYLDPVQERWGEICVFPELANEYADQLLPGLREAWSNDKSFVHFPPTTLCLSCLLETGRYEELRDVLAIRQHSFWPYAKFLAEALVRDGRVEEALEMAESHLEGSYYDPDILQFCEEILLSAGRNEEAYQRYGLECVHAINYLTIFRNTKKKYPELKPRQILLDLIQVRGKKGKWFAAAKDAGFLDIALDCASTGETDPRTLIRAARDFATTHPEFASKVSLLAIHALLDDKGYEPSPLDIQEAFEHLLTAAREMNTVAATLLQVQNMLNDEGLAQSPEMKAALELRLQSILAERGMARKSR